MTKKQLLKMFMWMSVGGAIGFLMGFTNIFAGISNNMMLLFNNLTKNKSIYIFLQLITTIIFIVISIIFFSIKKQIKNDNYSDDEGSVYSKKELLLNISLTTSSSSIYLNLMFYGIIMYYTVGSLNFNSNIVIFIIVTLIFLLNVIYGYVLEVQHVNLIKSVQNEKSADPSDFNYAFKAIETLDEQELLNAGKASLKSMIVNQIYILILFVFGFLTNQTPIYFITLLSIPIVNNVSLAYFNYRK